jgi:menaquinone-dependent protoporphyrinogen oxidase
MITRTILVVYATRFGSTQEVAETITSVLRKAGLEVQLQPMQEVQSLDGYEAVVLGAAIYNAHWHQDAHQFLAMHEAALQQRPVAIFALGPLGTSKAAMQRSRRQLEKELEGYPWLKPSAVEMFAGKYDSSKPGLSFFERLVPARDYRDWDAIRGWAEALATQLQHEKALQPA